MSEALIVRRGGTGGLSVNSAVIHVNAPLGSTVTFSKGGVVVKTLASGKGHANADGETADYYFSISPSNYGIWDVEASLDGASAGDSIEILTNSQHDVLIGYRVPAAYQAIEWLQTSNNAYFDTGIVPITTNYTTKVKVQVAVADGGNIFNVEGGYGMDQVGGYEQLRYNYDSGQTKFSMPGIRTIGEEFDILYNTDSGAVMVNGVQKSSHANIKALSNRQYSILVAAARYGATVSYYGVWRYIDFAVMERDTKKLLCDYRPCYRKSDSVPGFWDDVSKTFKTHIGTGTITAGPDL